MNISRRALWRGWSCISIVVVLGCGRTLPLPLDAGANNQSGFNGGPGAGGASGGGGPSVPPGLEGGMPRPPDARVTAVDPNADCASFSIASCFCPDGTYSGQKTTCYDSRGHIRTQTGCEQCQGPELTCAQTLPVSLPKSCVDSLCACDPLIAQSCNDACWQLLACVFDSCKGEANTACIFSECDKFLNGGGRAMAMFSNLNCVPELSSCFTRPPRCGDGVRQDNEVCDGLDFGGKSCEAFGLRSGKLACSPDCSAIDTTSCQFGNCGNGRIDQSEACDGNDLGGASCQNFGFMGGTLGCSGCAYDTRGCNRCGNGTVENNEACDGSTNGLTCQSLGYTGGVLGCNNCQLDTSGCALCGNGVIEAGENCDGDVSNLSCASLGLGQGTLSCDPSVCLIDARGCSPDGGICGNGVAERGETCDGMDLANLDCDQLGFNGGTLGCNQMTCRIDTSGCKRKLQATECSLCGRMNCSDSIDTCTSMPQCHGGLDCVAAMCGTDTSVDCALSCFGNTDAAVAALGMFACVVSKCGAECLGDL